MRRVGVLALQGAYRRHVACLERLGVESVEVRVPADLEGIDGLVLPGGESTAMSMLIDSAGLSGPLGDRLASGLPVLGTCAGMILLAGDVLGGRPDQTNFSAIDITVRRNAFGRQVESFEAEISLAGDPVPFPAVFIRAPVVERVGAGVEVLATVDRGPVLCRQGPVIVAAFHPELSPDLRVHEMFLAA